MAAGNKIADLEAQLAEARAEEVAKEKAARKTQSDAWKLIMADPASFEWRVESDVYRSYDRPQRIGARVDKRVKPEILKAWLANGLPSSSSDFQQEDRWFGMFYYRTEENILTHDGGGHVVLQDPMLCNDEEWAAILAGDIPLKYRIRK